MMRLERSIFVMNSSGIEMSSTRLGGVFDHSSCMYSSIWKVVVPAVVRQVVFRTDDDNISRHVEVFNNFFDNLVTDPGSQWFLYHAAIQQLPVRSYHEVRERYRPLHNPSESV